MIWNLDGRRPSFVHCAVQCNTKKAQSSFKLRQQQGIKLRLQQPSPREGDVKSTLYHRNLLIALSKVLAQGQVPAVPVAIMTTLPQGAEHGQNPAAFSHRHTCKLPEHGGVNASGITNQTYRCLINSQLHAEWVLFSEKPGGKKNKISWYSLFDALFLSVLDA